MGMASYLSILTFERNLVETLTYASDWREQCNESCVPIV